MHFDRLDELNATVQSKWHFEKVSQTGLTGLYDRSDWYVQIVQQTLVFANFGCQHMPPCFLVKLAYQETYLQAQKCT